MILLYDFRGVPYKGPPLLFHIRVLPIKELPENSVHKIEMDEILCYKEITAFFCLFNKI